MSFLELSHIEKSFGTVKVVKDFNLSIEKGEFISLLGPSGCGKTTVLRMLAGFETPTSGIVRLDGADVTHQRANQRRIGMVFQSYALFPNLTVAQNIGFGLEMQGRPAAEVKDRVARMLALVKLEPMAGRKTSQLSGGQQQRVAVGRALANAPRLLLADEPTGNLDEATAEQVFALLLGVARQTGLAALIATHNPALAARMDRTVHLSGGRIA